VLHSEVKNKIRVKGFVKLWQSKKDYDADAERGLN
jgi:hypothetical protein